MDCACAICTGVELTLTSAAALHQVSYMTGTSRSGYVYVNSYNIKLNLDYRKGLYALVTGNYC